MGPISGPNYHEGKAVYISESGLYILVLRSKLRAAKSFKKWVTDTLMLGLKEQKERMVTNSSERSTTNRARKFDGKEVNIKLDADRKEWFCGKDVCKILGFKNVSQTLLDRVKQAYKTGLKSLNIPQTFCANSVSYHAEKAVYISESDL